MVTQRTPEGWIKKSFKLPGLPSNPLLTYNFQSLGDLDCRLVIEWEGIKGNLSDKSNILIFNQHNFISAMWVMAAYELVRIFKNLDARPEVKETYELFRRVRIPLVKFEKPVNGEPTDFGIAHLAIGQSTKDLGWAIGPDTFISRNDLAESLYNLF